MFGASSKVEGKESGSASAVTADKPKSFKVVLYPDGDPARGRKKFRSSLVNGIYGPSPERTIGASFIAYRSMPYVHLEIWDLPSQSEYEAFRRGLMRYSYACVYIFDLRDKDCIENFRRNYREYIKVFEDPLVFIGFVSMPEDTIVVSYEKVKEYIELYKPIAKIIRPFTPGPRREFVDAKGFLDEVADFIYARELQEKSNTTKISESKLKASLSPKPSARGFSFFKEVLRYIAPWSFEKPAETAKKSSVPRVSYQDFIKRTKSVPAEINAEKLLKNPSNSYLLDIKKARSGEHWDWLVKAEDCKGGLSSFVTDLNRMPWKVNGENLGELFEDFYQRAYPEGTANSEEQQFDAFLSDELSPFNDALLHALSTWHQELAHFPVRVLMAGIPESRTGDYESIFVKHYAANIHLKGSEIILECASQFVGFRIIDNNGFIPLNLLSTVYYKFEKGRIPKEDHWKILKCTLSGSFDQVTKAVKVIVGKLHAFHLESEKIDSHEMGWRILSTLATLITNYGVRNLENINADCNKKLCEFLQRYLQTFKETLAEEREIIKLLKQYLLLLFSNPLNGVDRVRLAEVLLARQECLGDEFDSINFNASVEEILAELEKRIALLEHLRGLVVGRDERSRTYFEECKIASSSLEYLAVLDRSKKASNVAEIQAKNRAIAPASVKMLGASGACLFGESREKEHTGVVKYPPKASDKIGSLFARASLFADDSDDESLEDDQAKLLQRGYQLHRVPGDGNCFFHAVADQLAQQGIRDERGETYTHELLRTMVLSHVEAQPALRAFFTDRDMADLGRLTGWVGHEAIQALANLMNLSFRIIKKDGSEDVLIEPSSAAPEAGLVSLYYSPGHYDSLRTLVESAPSAARVDVAPAMP